MTIHIMPFPSLELNWLPNSITKNLPTPPIVITDCDQYSGAFYSPSIGEKYGVSLKNGLIEISTLCHSFESTVAHEYRHYWQLYNGTLGPGSNKWLELFQNDDTYEQAIIAYFTTQPHEMDALLFERKVAPNDLSDEWWEWIND